MTRKIQFIHVRRVRIIETCRYREPHRLLSRTLQQTNHAVREHELFRARENVLARVAPRALQGAQTDGPTGKQSRRCAYGPQFKLERGVHGLPSGSPDEIEAVLLQDRRAREESDGVQTVKDGAMKT